MPRRRHLILAGITALALSASGHAAELIATGSGVWLGDKGYVLTNHHVIAGCTSVAATIGADKAAPSTVIAEDTANDMALLHIASATMPGVSLRDGKPIRPGDSVVALGFPLAGLLAKEMNVSTGTVSALAGMGNDPRYLQISAPVQPGNSGGPLLDASGHLVGVVSAEIDAVRMEKKLHDIPQNVNFALNLGVVRKFLDDHEVSYRQAVSDTTLAPADIGDLGRRFTAYIECFGDRPARRGARAREADADAPAPNVPSLAPGLPAAPAVGTVLTFGSAERERGKKGEVIGWTVAVTAVTASGYQARWESATAGKATIELDRNPFTSRLSAVHELSAKAPPDAVVKMSAVQDHGLDKLFPLAPGKKATGTYKIAEELKSGEKRSDEMVEMCEVADWGSTQIAAGAYDVYRVVCGYGLKSRPGEVREEEDFFAPKLGIIIKSVIRIKAGRKTEENSAIVLMKAIDPAGHPIQP